MTRDELHHALQDAMVTERASSIAIQNMVGTFTWSGLTDEQREQVIKRLESLSAGPQRRAQRLKSMIARL